MPTRSQKRSGRLVRAATATIAGLIAAAGAAAAQRAPTVETIAGPGFCQGVTRIDPEAGRVGAIAIDSDGWMFTDLPDAPGRGIIRASDGTQISQLTSNEPAPPVTDALQSLTGPPAASRLAGAGGGAVAVAAGPRVVEIGSNPPSLRSLAGTPSTQTGGGGSASSGDGGLAAAARFTSARSITADDERNLFIADAIDSSAATFRIRFLNRSDHPVTFYGGTADELTVGPGRIDTIAGSPSQDAPTGGNRARNARLQGVPPALAVSGSGLYIATFWPGPNGGPPAGTVRLVNLGGQPLAGHGVTVAPGGVETVAGGPPPASDADGGPARSALLSYVPGIAVGRDGLLFLAERDRDLVRVVDQSGTISTFAGKLDSRSTLGPAPLDRPAREVSLNRPVDVKAGPGGVIYIADEGSGHVLVVNSAGMVRLAGGVSYGTRCESPVAAASIGEGSRPETGSPYSVVAGTGGSIYFVNLTSRQVMKRDAAGETTVVQAVSATCAPTGDCPASSPLGVRSPGAVAFANGGLYVYDVLGARVLFLNLGAKQVTVNGVVVPPGAVRTLAGDGTAGSGGDGGPAIAAQLGGQGATRLGSFPLLPSIPLTEGAVGDIAVAPDGTLFIGDGANSRVRQVDRAGIISTIAGMTAPPAASACCTMPSGLATDGFGNLYVSDMGTRRIWFVNRGAVSAQAHGQSVPAGAAVAIAGNGNRAIGGDGVALQVPVYQPTGLATDGLGNVYVADYHDDTVRRVDPSGMISTVAGTGAGGFNGDGLPPYQTALFTPTDIAFDPCGNLLIADMSNDRVRRVDVAGPCPATAPTSPGTASSNIPLLVLAGAGTVLAVVLTIAALRRAAWHQWAGKKAGWHREGDV